MMSSNVVLLHSNNCCVVLKPAICEDLDLHIAIFIHIWIVFPVSKIYSYVLFCCYFDKAYYGFFRDLSDCDSINWSLDPNALFRNPGTERFKITEVEGITGGHTVPVFVHFPGKIFSHLINYQGLKLSFLVFYYDAFLTELTWQMLSMGYLTLLMYKLSFGLLICDQWSMSIHES